MNAINPGGLVGSSLGVMPVEEDQDSFSERQVAWQHRIAEFRKIAAVKMFGRFENYFSGCSGYDFLAFWAG
ncbi:MAG: hypothetical protein WCC26_17570 [Terracidiphilus sp.]